MAKYNIYGHVLYSEIEYEKLMHTTERIFINGLQARLKGIDPWMNEIWNNIDHSYMVKTLDEIKQDVIKSDVQEYFMYKNTVIEIDDIKKRTESLKDLYEINSIAAFKNLEKKYGKRVADYYRRRIETLETGNYDELEYLTQQIKDFDKVQNIKAYRNKLGDIVRHVNISTYLSMLYNVNITRTGWNQTFKDAEYFENDLVLLETHPNSCKLCAPMQRKSVFKNW